MKKLIIVAAIAALAGCSSTKLQNVRVEDVNVKETRLATDFKRQGVRVHYTFGGDVEKVEAFGYAPVWRGEYRIAAEADAKDKLVKFLRGESVESTRMTRVIAKSIERSQDNSLNKFRTQDGKVTIADTDLEKEDTEQADNDTGEENSKQNSALRKASINNARIVTSTIVVSARGRLSGVYKKEGYVQEDGKTYTAVYVWTPKNQEAARIVTTLMDK
jgi:hypothetical protein